MKLLDKFLNLPQNKQFLLIKACIFVYVVRFILFIFPIKVVLQYLSYFTKKTHKLNKNNRLSEELILWAIETVSKFILSTNTCIIKSITAQILLTQHGYKSSLYLGIAKDKVNQKDLQSHAWLESNGKVIVGENMANNYKPILKIS